eukprot:c27393_g1_i1 orf=2-172(-)
MKTGLCNGFSNLTNKRSYIMEPYNMITLRNFSVHKPFNNVHLHHQIFSALCRDNEIK